MEIVIALLLPINKQAASDTRCTWTTWCRSIQESIHLWRWRWRLCADRWLWQQQTTSDERAGRVQCSTVTAASAATTQRCAVQQQSLCDIIQQTYNLQVLVLNCSSIRCHSTVNVCFFRDIGYIVELCLAQSMTDFSHVVMFLLYVETLRHQRLALI